jgi:hypothetical protein
MWVENKEAAKIGEKGKLMSYRVVSPTTLAYVFAASV